jgi:hypothetical protein
MVSTLEFRPLLSLACTSPHAPSLWRADIGGGCVRRGGGGVTVTGLLREVPAIHNIAKHN